jgi:DNA-3-methyladenine glycosylase
MKNQSVKEIYMVLDKKYFTRPATELAVDLLGKHLCVRCGDEILRKKITETECYYGEEDTACHAHKGKTERTEVMYWEGGVAYVYLCYGIHSLLNIVTGHEGHPEAVLIRGVEGAEGPGRVTKMMGISRSDNKTLLNFESKIWIEEGSGDLVEYSAQPRVGIDYADRVDRERKWRYKIKK